MSRAAKLEKQISFAPDTVIPIPAKDSEPTSRGQEDVETTGARNDQSQKGTNQLTNTGVENTNYDLWSRQPDSSAITLRRKPGEKAVVRRFVKERPNPLLDRLINCSELIKLKEITRVSS